MKATITIFVFLLSSYTALFASDYQTVYSNRVAMFQDWDFYGMKMDSVKVQENDSVFYPVKRISGGGEDSYWSCYTPYGASWLGEKIIISGNWNNFITNRDTLRINTAAGLNETWICFSTPNYSVEATVSKHELQSFLGVEDSVKTILFQAFDKDRQPLNLWEDKTLEISKSYGLIRGFDFFGNNQEYTLQGLSDPKIGIQNITWRDVWDFQPGDELHISESGLSYSAAGNGLFESYGTETKRIIRYLERQENENVLSYKVAVKEAIYAINNTGGKNTTLLSCTDYETTNEIYPDDTFDRLPGEVLFDENNSFANTYIMYYNDGFIVKSRDLDDVHHNDDSQCWEKITNCGCTDTYKYIAGLGGPYFYCHEDVNSYDRTLVYYKKRNVVWGAPLHLTGIDQVNGKASSVVYDPARETFRIDLNSDASSCLFELFDLSGRRMLQGNVVSSHHSVPVANLQKGIYIYRLTEKGQTISAGKIVK